MKGKSERGRAEKRWEDEWEEEEKAKRKENGEEKRKEKKREGERKWSGKMLERRVKERNGVRDMLAGPSTSSTENGAAKTNKGELWYFFLPLDKAVFYTLLVFLQSSQEKEDVKESVPSILLSTLCLASPPLPYTFPYSLCYWYCLFIFVSWFAFFSSVFLLCFLRLLRLFLRKGKEGRGK